MQHNFTVAEKSELILHVVLFYRGCAAVRLLKSMVAIAWQPAPEGLAQILQLLRVSFEG